MRSKSVCKFRLLLVGFLCLVVYSSAIAKKNAKEKTKIDPTRTEKLVRGSVIKVFPVISEALEKVKSVYGGDGKVVSLRFYISPTGIMTFRGFVENVILDKNQKKILKEDLVWQVLSEVKKMETVCQVVVTSELGKNNKIELSEKISVSYVEIRSQSSILMVIDMNKRDLRKVYSKGWAKNKSLQGTLYVKFSIDETGKVIKCEKEKSTMNDSEFENTVIKIAKYWNFGVINNPGDITEIIYPFTFNQ